MNIDLPEVIDAYFRADKKGGTQSLADLFTPDAVVVDEGNTYTGRDAIRHWMTNASTRYTYTVEPFAQAKEDGRTVISCHLVGNFPGSPVDLRYFFVLKSGMIAELEIVP